MRQAGRFLPEYRALRAQHTLLELCHEPELAAQVSLLPVERLQVDAAIIFADILLPFEPLGLGLSFTAGESPPIQYPIPDAAPGAPPPPPHPPRGRSPLPQPGRPPGRAPPPRSPPPGFARAP